MTDLIPDVSQRIVEPAGVEVLVVEGRTVLRRERFGPVRGAILRALRQTTTISVRLDPLAKAAWDLFDGTRTVAQVRRELEARFPRETDIGPRLGRLLGALVSHKMVRLL